MGLFDFLFPKKTYNAIDYWYVNQSQKQQGIVKLAKENPGISIYSYFKKDIETFNKLYPELKIKHINLYPVHNNDSICIIIDHYPLYKKEQAVLAALKVPTIYFFSSLDSIIFKKINTWLLF